MPRSKRITVREASHRLMRDYGMTTVFGNPGSTELPFFRNWPNDFQYVLGLNEAVVMAMADGFAQASGKAAFVNLHSSAGVGHAMGNLFTAYRNNTPLVVTAGQQARSMLPLDPFLGAESPTEFPKPFVKWAIEPARAEDVPAAIARAYQLAMTAPRGPVFVSVPADDWDAPCDPVAPRPLGGDPQADPAGLAAIAQMLTEARAPALVVGPELDQAGDWSGAVALAERLACPVWMAPRSHRAAFPERHPLFAGFLPPHRHGVHAAFIEHDVVLVLGAPAFTYHVHSEGPFLPEDVRLAQVTNDARVAARSPEGLCLVGDAAAAARALAGLVPAGFAPAAQPPRRPGAPEGGSPVTVAFLMAELARLKPAGSIIVEEAPTSRTTMQELLPIDEPGGFLTMASGGLGYGLAAAVGVALARRDRQVIAVIGDGSSLYNIQALWTAVQLGVGLTVVIVNNGGYEALRTFGSMLGVTPVGVEIPGVDFPGLARAQGCDAIRVERSDDLAAALEQAFASQGPVLVDVAVGSTGGI